MNSKYLNGNLFMCVFIVSIGLIAFLSVKVLLCQEDASGFQYAFRMVRAKNHLNVGMTKSEVISLIGSEPDRVHHEETMKRYTWSTAYRVGTITRLIYAPAPHGQYLEVTFDRDERVVKFDWSEI